MANFNIDRLRIRCREGLMAPFARRYVHFADVFEAELSDEDHLALPGSTDLRASSIRSTVLADDDEYPAEKADVTSSEELSSREVQIAGVASTETPPPFAIQLK